MPEKSDKDIQQESLDDLARRYRGAFFLLFNQTGGKEVVFLEEVSVGPDMGTICHLSNSEGRVFSDSLKNLKVVEVYPEKGLYNYIPKSKASRYPYDPVVKFSRIPRRQWAHGIRKETCTLETIFGTDILAAACAHYQPWQSLRFDIELVENLFNPQYPASWEAALKLLDARPQVALSRDFMLMWDFVGPNMLITKQFQVIGEADKNSIKLFEPVLAQEVIDLIKRNRYEIKFEVA